MIIEEIHNARVQSIIAEWKRWLCRQQTIGDHFGELRSVFGDTPEIKEAIAFFEKQGLVVSVKKNHRLSVLFLSNSEYTITFKKAADYRPAAEGGKTLE